MKWRTHEIHITPSGYVTHYGDLRKPNYSVFHAECGSFGYDMIFTNTKKEVTCQRCLHLITLNRITLDRESERV